ncbi:MAG: hypothetical protein M1475_00510 [Actinobacteria bacterium]|nr:hypothetical protein [Actinomycetota bacterium]MCL6086873.1 hypothetical protein [Actinomycetota bacterium]
MSDKKYTVKVPGSCGELLQGITNGINFHVTCPVKLFSEISVNIIKNSEIICEKNYQKAIMAMKKTLQYFGADNYGGEIKIKSEIPAGKGMASSTADISGIIISTALSLNKTITEEETAKIALSIEPSDGIMFRGICLFDHKLGKIHEYLGNIPENRILILDLGGTVDTLEFNNRDFLQELKENEDEINKALKILKDGISNKDLQKVCEASTASAILNQKILYKKNLLKIIDFSLINGALGINIAHSGTVIGIIFCRDFNKISKFADKLQKELNTKLYCFESEITGGGAIY